jgi:hypothetical protein
MTNPCCNPVVAEAEASGRIIIQCPLCFTTWWYSHTHHDGLGGLSMWRTGRDTWIAVQK